MKLVLAVIAVAWPSVPSVAWSWTADCKLHQCGVSASAVDSANKHPVITLTVLVKRDRSDPQLLATMPLGTALEPGARAKFGGITLNLKFKACYPDGCRAHAILDDALLQELASANDIEVQYFAQSSEHRISATLPLQGLSQSLAQLPQRSVSSVPAP